MESSECMCPILGRATKVRPSNYSRGDWKLVECEETGFVFLQNPPTYDAVASEFAWEKTFAEEQQSRREREPIIAYWSSRFKKLRAHLFRKRDKMFSLATRHVGDKRSVALLDIGVERGHRMAKFLSNFKERGVDVVPSGIEISEELAAHADGYFRKFGGSVVAEAAIDGVTKFPKDSFDIVVMSCYLEHESQPLEVLRRTREILQTDGHVLVKVPNFNSFNRHMRGSRWCGFRFPDHVNYFTPATMRILASEAGYDVLPPNWSDCLPTSDNMYLVLRKKVTKAATLRHAA